MTSTITGVTVFLEGAEITRTVTVDVPAGPSDVRLTGLPVSLVAESVTAGLSGNAQMLTVSCRPAPVQAPERTEALRQLQAEWTTCKDQLAQTLLQQQVLADEYAFLQDNRKVGGMRGARLDEIQRMADYYRQRLEEIACARLHMQKEQAALEAKQERLSSQLAAYPDVAEPSSVDIVVELAAAAACPVQITVSYFVPCAGWRPSYELRVTDTTHPALLICKGDVYQHTGEDWVTVPLVLSSGRPSLHGEPPELRPWYLDIETPIAATARFTGAAPSPDSELEMESADCYTSLPAHTVSRQTGASVEFVLSGPVSIPALGDGQPLELARHELDAHYLRLCVPKLDTDVFLLAQITGWASLDLLEGDASVFLGNSFVGQTSIVPGKDEDITVSLGRDSGVFVTRMKGPDYTGRTRLGNSRKVSREWVITIRNTRHDRIALRVLDQLPVSVSKLITVEPIELSGAEHDPNTGELCWEPTLEPGESAQLTVSYTVTYPKKESIWIE